MGELWCALQQQYRNMFKTTGLGFAKWQFKLVVYTAYVQRNKQRSPVLLEALLCTVPHAQQLSQQSSASWRGQHRHHHQQQQLLLIHSEVAVPAAEAPVGQAVGSVPTGLTAEAVSFLPVPAAAAEPASQET